MGETCQGLVSCGGEMLRRGWRRETHWAPAQVRMEGSTLGQPCCGDLTSPTPTGRTLGPGIPILLPDWSPMTLSSAALNLSVFWLFLFLFFLLF